MKEGGGGWEGGVVEREGQLIVRAGTDIWKQRPRGLLLAQAPPPPNHPPHLRDLLCQGYVCILPLSVCSKHSLRV